MYVCMCRTASANNYKSKLICAKWLQSRHDDHNVQLTYYLNLRENIDFLHHFKTISSIHSYLKSNQIIMYVLVASQLMHLLKL